VLRGLRIFDFRNEKCILMQDQAERGLSGFDFHVYRIAESPDWRVSRRSRYLASEVNVNPLLMI